MRSRSRNSGFSWTRCRKPATRANRSAANRQEVAFRARRCRRQRPRAGDDSSPSSNFGRSTSSGFWGQRHHDRAADCKVRVFLAEQLAVLGVLTTRPAGTRRRWSTCNWGIFLTVSEKRVNLPA